MDKRGISPLIATVLIIGFTVALGAIIFLWASGFVDDVKEGTTATSEKSSSCAVTNLKLEGIEQTAPNKLKFLLENIGQSDVDSVIVRITGDKGVASVTKPGVSSAGKKAFQADFDPAVVGVITGVEVIPNIKVGGKSASCAPGISLSASVPEERVDQWADNCGNGAIDEWEECEGDNLGGWQCTDGGYAGGNLKCTGCIIDVSECTEGTTCGNFVLNVGEEECDVDMNHNPLFAGLPEGEIATCNLLGMTGGVLYCSSLCLIDTSECSGEPSLCGNGVKDEFEECDGADLDGKDCVSLEFIDGSLSCTPSCKFNTDYCMLLGIGSAASFCGNGEIEGLGWTPEEKCDGT
ncbi:MAG: archaellin/type IV pilin N-terminal domain-containing protein, partial [archaeon]